MIVIPYSDMAVKVNKVKENRSLLITPIFASALTDTIINMHQSRSTELERQVSAVQPGHLFGQG